MQPSRFQAFILVIALCMSAVVSAATTADTSPIRIGITPVFLDSQTAFLNKWRVYLEARLKRDVVFKQRSNYRQVIDLLLNEELDFAWLCGYPFVRFKPHLRLLAVPTYQGKPLYQSYLIVPSSDTNTQSIADLKNKIFAYSDPDSNSGYLVPQYDLHRLGADRNSFFRRSFFTWTHQKVVRAVAAGLADGGAVDGYVWDTLAKARPDLTARTRVVKKSKQFGFPPFVARRSVSESDFQQMQQALLGMQETREGRKLLVELNLDGFGAGEEALFDGIASLAKAILEN